MTQYEKDQQSAFYPLFLELRQKLISIDGVEETRKPRITTFSRNKKGICHMRTMATGVDMGFLKGAKFEDTPKMLTGNGKAIRVLTLSAFDQKLIDYYLKQALEWTEI